MKKVIQLLLIFVCISGQSHAQLSNWATPPYSWDMTAANPVSSPLPLQSDVTNYSVSNGIYDADGNLLFFVRDRDVFSSSGTLIGQLPVKYQQCVMSSETYDILNTEISIVPIPGQCNKFYIIYGMSSLAGGKLLYVEIDLSTPTPTIISSSCFGVLNEAFEVQNHYGALQVSFAVSKVYTGNGSNSKRFIYSVSTDGIVRSEITSTGISAGVIVASSYQLGLSYISDFSAYEAELSQNGKYFAWSSAYVGVGNADVHTIELDPSTGAYLSGTIKNYIVGDVVGLEFLGGTNPDLYTTGSTGLRVIKTSTSTLDPNNRINGVDLSRSYLERGYNGKLYALGFNTTISNPPLQFWQITPNNPNAGAISPSFNSEYILNGFDYITSVYTLPDQIDGEKTMPLAVNLIKMGGVGTIYSKGLPETCFSRMPEYCPNQLSMLPTFSGDPNEYRITIKGVDRRCNILPVSAGKVSYVGSWSSEIPTILQDISGLTDIYGRNLANVGGSYMILIEARDACGNLASKTGYLNVLENIPPILSLEIYDTTNPQVWKNPSQDIQNPISVGTASVAYRVNNSSGTIQSYSVKIEEVNSSTGQVIQEIYNKSQNIANVSTLTSENLNSYCINQIIWPSTPIYPSCTNGYTGYHGYFSYTNGINVANKTFKLTLTLSNQCSSTSDYSYIKVDLIGQRPLVEVDPLAGIFNTGFLNSELLIYPNPVNNILNINTTLKESGKYELYIFDTAGRLVYENNIQYLNRNSYFMKNIDISNLENGMYLLKLRSGDYELSEKFQVLR